MDLSGLNSAEEEDSREEYQLRLFRSLDIMCYVVYSLVFVLCVLGSGVVVWATAFKLKRTASTVWFLNLAVSDLLYAATLPLRIMHQALDYHWPLGRVMCKLYFTVDSLTMFASVYLLVVIGVDRCVSMGWPSSAWVQMNWCGAWRRKASYVSAAVVWALATVLTSPLFFSLDTPSSRHEENSTKCTVVFSNSNSNSNSSLFSDNYYDPSPSVVRLNERALDVLNITYSFLGFVAPLVAIVSCYAVILWRRRNSGHRSPLGRPFSIRAAITASFFLCFTPYHVQEFFDTAPAEEGGFDTFYAVWWNVAGCLEALYHCLNPLLYATVARDLRNKVSLLDVLESAFAEEEARSEPPADLPLSDKE